MSNKKIRKKSEDALEDFFESILKDCRDRVIIKDKVLYMTVLDVDDLIGLYGTNLMGSNSTLKPELKALGVRLKNDYPVFWRFK